MRSAILLSAILLCRYHNPSLGMSDLMAYFITVAFVIFLAMDLYELWGKP